MTAAGGANLRWPPALKLANCDSETWWWKWLASAGLLGGLVLLGNEASLSGYSTADAITIHGLLFVSHHFMSKAQLETPLGQERVQQCVFTVPVNGQLVSMCEVNALGIREEYYAQIARRPAAESRRAVGVA